MKEIQDHIDTLIIKKNTKKNPAGETFDQCLKKYDFDPTVRGVVLDNKEILEVLLGFIVFSEFINDTKEIEKFLKDFSRWIEGFPGNDEDGATQFFFANCLKQKKTASNTDEPIKEYNSLMLRVALAASETEKQESLAEVDFSPVQFMIFTLLTTDTDDFNRLIPQPEFIHELIGMPDGNSQNESEKEFFRSFV